MWILHDTTFTFFDDVFIFSKAFEVIGRPSYVILHWQNENIAHSIVDEESYRQTKDKLHNLAKRLLSRDLWQMADYHKALARPIITPEVVERLESLVGTRIYRDLVTGIETREAYYGEKSRGKRYD
jgi:hypothetical protein